MSIRNLQHICCDINGFLFILAQVKTGRPSKRTRTTFGQNLYDARVAIGLSQAQIAKKLGITQTAYSLWERRTVALRSDQIEKLLEVLDVNADQLFPKPLRKKTPASRAKP